MAVITGCGWVLADQAGSTEQLPAAGAIVLVNAGTSLRVSDALPDAYPTLKPKITRDKGAWMSAIAIEHALAEAGMSRESIAPDRTGLVVGSPLAGQLGMLEFAGEVREQSPRFVSPINFPRTVGNFIGGAIARAYDLKGPNLTIASGAASGFDAIIEGCGLIRAGGADVVLAGVTEGRSDALARAFANKPGAAVEGACWFVLERAEHRPNTPRGCAIDSWRQFGAGSESGLSTWGSLAGPIGLVAWIAQQAHHALPTALAELLCALSGGAAASPDATTLVAGSAGQHFTSLTVLAARH